MTIIEQIKAKIDKLYCEYKDKFHQCGDQYHLGLIDGLDMAEQVLDTLESEKPIIPDGLDEEVHGFFEECIEVHEVPLYGKVKEDVITADCYEITARHFAKWGAERQKEQDLAEMAQSKSPLSVAYANRCFENGKQAMKEQMMKETERSPKPELTWEDIAKIDALILEANNEFAVDYSKEISREQFYTEVLNRFNKCKEEQK